MTVTCESRVTTRVTFGVSHRTPSRPVPTRPISVVTSAVESKTNLPKCGKGAGSALGFGGNR